MRHQVHGKKLNRSSGHRKALYRNMTQSLIEHERITTTLVKAKAVRPVVEKLITRAKAQDLASRRAVIAYLPTEVAAEKLFTVLAPRFADRPGGYTRVIKIGRRTGDGSEMAVLEFVELSAPTTASPRATTRTTTKSKPKKTDEKESVESSKAEPEVKE